MLKCKGFKQDFGSNGYEYDCNYEHSDIGCEDCILSGGTLSPQTGKEFRGNLKKYQDSAKARYELDK